MLFNWFDLITRFQLKRNSTDYRSAIKMIEKSEAQFDKHFTGKEIKGNFYLVGALYGLFFAQRMNAAAYDKFHQLLRRSFDMSDFSLQETEGMLSRQRVSESFNEIRLAILYRSDNFEQRDLRFLAFWLMTASFVCGVTTAFV